MVQRRGKLTDRERVPFTPSQTAGVLPNFFIIGAPRAGTSWLYRQLLANPSVFMPSHKEPRYFAVDEGEVLNFRGPGDATWLSQIVSDRNVYEQLFCEASQPAVGEASTDYLYRSDVASRRMKELVPDARLIVLLRHPAERAYSNWMHHRRDERETLEFAEALAAEPRRIDAGWAWWWHYVQRGFYGRQLQPFIDTFPRRQLLVLLFDEVRADPANVIERVSRFLDVPVVRSDSLDRPANESWVPAGGWRAKARRAFDRHHRWSARLLPAPARRGLRRRFDEATRPRPSLDAAVRQGLGARYQDDLRVLERLVGVDVGHWT